MVHALYVAAAVSSTMSRSVSVGTMLASGLGGADSNPRFPATMAAAAAAAMCREPRIRAARLILMTQVLLLGRVGRRVKTRICHLKWSPGAAEIMHVTANKLRMSVIIANTIINMTIMIY